MNNDINNNLRNLSIELDGELRYDNLSRSLYSTDASVYRIPPLAVCYPKNDADIIKIIEFVNRFNLSLIPRAAGTSLAGQCVGEGIVVDISRHFNKILSVDVEGRTVRLQPGVIRDSLNMYLQPYGLFFGPNTSTSNRCMIGGMVGNNSSGTTSIKYGVTRDKVVSIKTILSDGSKVEFKELNEAEFFEKANVKGLEGKIYAGLYDLFKNDEVKTEIVRRFPKPEIHRRNTGYALDELIKSKPFGDEYPFFNLCKLLSGSEGTLAFTTEITLSLDPLPPEKHIMIAAHYDTIRKCLDTVVPAMKHDLYGCEMMDKTILDCTKHNKEQQINRAFVKGDPEAILMLELRSDSEDELKSKTKSLLENLKLLNNSYALVLLTGRDINKAVELRKAGLGLLGNIVGDAKGVACIEDTAVAINDLADYIHEFSKIMDSYKQKSVYYAHAGAGEIHLRPILNLKLQKDVELFKSITDQVSDLVIKYRGSMSGEHGDGIVRSYLIEKMIGEKNYHLLQQVKQLFDPNSIFNPGKIVDPKPMEENLRYKPGRKEPVIETKLDFSNSLGILREAEKCNGSGDCRKLPESGGTMCPSYRATLNEKDSTRGRANALRDFLTNSSKPNRFNHQELKEVFDLCLSCKACATECPSSVDVASLKAEFQYQYQKSNGSTRRDKILANNNYFNSVSSRAPIIANLLFSAKISSYIIKKSTGIASERSLPKISSNSLIKLYKSTVNELNNKEYIKKIYLFNDEFTNHLESDIGMDAIYLLRSLNYDIRIIDNVESGRAFISKGFLDKAKFLADKNIDLYKDLISSESPLIGIEPSTILTFVDEYPKLASDKENAIKIASNTFLIEEFLQNEIKMGNIRSDQFTDNELHIKFHGHCYQKALRNQMSSFQILNLPKNYRVTIIPSGCCGMAGSFGYEKEHYDISMAIGEQTLFPAIRRAKEDVMIAANGTSCRHQIKDGTARIAKHPVSILARALAINESEWKNG